MKSLWPVVVVVLLGGSAPLTNDVIRVQRFELVDGKGRARIVMQVMEDGTAAIGFGDRRGQMGLLITMDANDTPKVVVQEPGGAAVAGLVVLDGTPAFATTDSAGQVRVLLRTERNGASSLNFYDEQKDPRVTVAADGYSSKLILHPKEDPKNGVTLGASETSSMVSLLTKRDGQTSQAVLGATSGEARSASLILNAGKGGVHASADQETGAVTTTLGKKRADLGFFGDPTTRR